MNWPNGVPILDGQRMRQIASYVGESDLCEIWWQAGSVAYVKWDDHMYATLPLEDIGTRFERIGSTAANARSDAVRTIISNMGYAPAYFSLWWGLEPLWRAAMGDSAADELRVRRDSAGTKP